MNHHPAPVTVDNPVNLLSTESRFQGILELSDYSHFNGQITGTIRGLPGSTFVLGEQGVVEGTIDGDVVVIDGYVRGEIRASTKVIISETGRVIGKISAKNFSIIYGGFFDGECATQI